VERPERYRWSSAAAHISGRDDALVKVEPLLEVVGDWREFLSEPEKAEEAAALRQRERTGRPLGSESFIVWLEGVVGRGLRPRKRGPKPGVVRS